MAEKWVKDAWSEARLAENLRAETSKSLATAKQKNKEITTKLAAEDRGRKSAEAGLKNVQAQAEEHRKKLHYVEIEVATTTSRL